jgi:hypothetical protein
VGRAKGRSGSDYGPAGEPRRARPGRGTGGANPGRRARPPPPRRLNFISPGYFETLGTKLLAGRHLTWADVEAGGRIVAAQPREPKRLLLRRGLALGGVGAVVGLVAAVALGRSMSTLLFGIALLDPVAYLAALATYVPARRAASVDPVRTLKAE